jgi:DNA replication protein DnaC
LEAVARIRAFSERGESVLAVVGRRGLGKTQVLSVAVWQAIERGASGRLVTALALVRDLKRRFSDGVDAEGDWLLEWRGPRLLCIDEIGELVAGDHSRAMLVALIDERYRECRPTIVAGNIEVAALADVLGASVASRCSEGGGAVVFDGWASFRTAAAREDLP